MRIYLQPSSVTLPGSVSPSITMAMLPATESLPTDLPVAIYYRQSTKEAVGNTSTHFQQVDLVDYLQHLGWHPEQILLIDLDAGVSGQRSIAARDGMSYLFDLIQSESIGAVAVSHVDRFFRDVAQIETNLFIEACRSHHVYIITPTTHFNFAHPLYGADHLYLFRQQAQQAADVLQTQFVDRLQRGREYYQGQGRWAGGSIPIGYMVDNRKTLANGSANPDWRKFLPFPPYAEVVRGLFKLVDDLDGNLFRAGRSLQKHGPFFPEEAEQLVPVGHYITTIPQLRSPYTGGLMLYRGTPKALLTNGTYLGHWLISGVVRRWHNHEALIDESLFRRVFNRLSSTDLDGQPNAQYQPRAIRSILRPPAKRQPSTKESGQSAAVPLLRKSAERVRSAAYPRYAGVVYLLAAGITTPVKCQCHLSGTRTPPQSYYRYSAQMPGRHPRADYLSVIAAVVDEQIDQLIATKVRTYQQGATQLRHDCIRILEGTMTDIAILQRLIASTDRPEAVAVPEQIDEAAPRQSRVYVLGAANLTERVLAELERLVQEREAAAQLLRWLATQAEPLSTSASASTSSRVNLEALFAPPGTTLGRAQLRSAFDELGIKVQLTQLATASSAHAPAMFEIAIHWRDGSTSSSTLPTTLLQGIIVRKWSQEDGDRLDALLASNAAQVDILQAFPERTWIQIKNRYRRTHATNWSASYRGEIVYAEETSWHDVLTGSAKESRTFINQRPRTINGVQLICPHCRAATNQRQKMAFNTYVSYRCQHCGASYRLYRQANQVP